MALTPTAHLVEWLDLAGSVLAEPLQVVEGQITPRGPGFVSTGTIRRSRGLPRDRVFEEVPD